MLRLKARLVEGTKVVGYVAVSQHNKHYILTLDDIIKLKHVDNIELYDVEIHGKRLVGKNGLKIGELPRMSRAHANRLIKNK